MDGGIGRGRKINNGSYSSCSQKVSRRCPTNWHSLRIPVVVNLVGGVPGSWCRGWPGDHCCRQSRGWLSPLELTRMPNRGRMDV